VPPPSPAPAAPRRPPPSALSTTASRRGWRARLGAVNNQLLLIGGTALVIVVVALLILYASYSTYIKPGAETAVRVGSRDDDMVYFTRRMRDYLNSPAGAVVSGTQLLTLPTQLADNIIEEETLIQRAGALGVGVSSIDIDKEVATRVRAITSTADNGAVVRNATTDLAIREYLRASGLSLAEFRRAVHGQVLKPAVQAFFRGQVPAQLPQARFRIITVADEQKAKDLKQQADGGADFATLATQNSTDTATRAQGGFKDWTPKGLLDQPIDDAVFSIPLNTVSDPIKNGDSWSLVRVEERSDARDVTDQDRESLGARRYSDWLDQQKKDLNARGYMDDTARQSYALEHSNALDRLRNSSTSPSIPQPEFTVSPPVGSPAAAPPAASPAAGTPSGGTP
jgi:parvulin-like peptidyl-prolyl isomerase